MWVEFVSYLKKRDITCFHNKFSSRYLSTLSLEISTLIDIGVDHGTPSLYNTFKNAGLVLIDPIAEALAEVEASLTDRKVSCFPVAASDIEHGTVRLMIPESARGHATIAGWEDRGRKISETREVKTRRVDSIIDDAYPAPFGIKIDVEGWELPVYRGCQGILKSTLFVILEVNIKTSYSNQSLTSDIFAALAKDGFELFEILNPSGRPPAFMDMLFLKNDHPLFKFN